MVLLIFINPNKSRVTDTDNHPGLHNHPFVYIRMTYRTPFGILILLKFDL